MEASLRWLINWIFAIICAFIVSFIGYAVLGLIISAAHADETCFIDGSFTPRCMDMRSTVDDGVSWPVFTADTPLKVWIHSINQANPPGSPPFAPIKLPSVLNVFVGQSEETYPDVMCLVFKNGSQTCFDTMEITER